MKEVDHLSMDLPVRCSADQIINRKIKISGPSIYTIHDKDGACAYIGRTNNIRNRLKAHKSGHNKKQTEVKDIFLLCDPMVDIYGPLATDRLIMERGGESLTYRKFVVKTPSLPNNDWLVQGELVHCQILRPYLNRKLTYMHGADWLLKMGLDDLYPSTVYENMISFGVREPTFSMEMVIAFDRVGVDENDRAELLIEFENKVSSKTRI